MTDNQRGQFQARPHLLVVTDDEDLRDFLQEGLLLGGFWVSVIASAIQTLEVFRLRSFDLVLIDAALPGLDATELIRRLRGNPKAEAQGPRTDVPIYLILDRPSAGDAGAAAAGADGILVPPIELEHLIPLLQQSIQDWRSRHPDRPWADQAAQLRPEQ